MICVRFPFFAIPNGIFFNAKSEKQRKIYIAKLKNEGLRPGVPDVMIPVARGGYHGLFIEMKRKDGGDTSPEQLKWHKILREQGYRVEVCHGYAAAMDVVEGYMGREVNN